MYVSTNNEAIMIEIGKVNKLTVIRAENNSYLLRDLESGEQVYMPQNLATIHFNENDEVDTFVYMDTQDQMVGTNHIPYAVVGEFGHLTVKEVHEFGAFFHWGTRKDLLVPGNEQKTKVAEGEDHIVRVCLEEGTNRVYGTTKLGKYIENAEFDIKDGDKVKAVPVEKSELGYRCIVNKKFIGMIYHNEIFEEVYMGQNYEAIVKKIREDGLVDLSMQKLGIRNVVESKDVILDYLKHHNGVSHLHDKSSPDDIKAALAMSKKTFKGAIGMLYKEKKIIIKKDGIELVK